MKSKNRETFKWNEITSIILKFKIPPGDTLHCISLPSSSPSHDSKLSNRIQPIDTRDISTTLSSLSNKKTQKTPERGTLTNGIANISSRNPRWTKLPSRLERGPFSGEFSRRNRDTQNTQRHEKKNERKRKNREREGEIKQSEKKGKREKGWREEKIPLFRHDTASKRASARAIFFDQSSDERATSSLRCARVYNSPPLPQRITYVELWPGNAAGVALCLAFDNRSARRLRYRAEEWKDARFWNDGDRE